MIRRRFIAAVLQLGNHLIQALSPKLLKRAGVSKPFYNGRANRIVHLDKRPPAPACRQIPIPKSAKRPHFGTVIGAVYAGRHITALRGRMAVAAGKVGAAASAALVFGVIVIVPAKRARVAMSDFPAIAVIMIVPAEEADVAMSDFIALFIIVGIAAEQIGPADAGLLSVLVIMINIAEKSSLAVSFVAHTFSSRSRKSQAIYTSLS